MPNVTVSTNVDTLLKSANNAAMRSNLGLGDAATKNTGIAAGTVAAGDDSRITGALQTSGGTMTGRIIAAADASIAKISVGARTTGSSPTGLVDGDIWISNQGALSYRDSTGPTSRAVAATSLSNNFNQPQTIGSTANAAAVLSVTNSGTREVATFTNTATATSDAVVITNLGSGNSLVVNDETTPDSTRFAVANNGRVGIGVAPDASVALAVDSTGIKFSDNSIQTTAGLTGTVQEANGGTGETTYTNGQLLIGNAAGGLTKATLTAGSNVTITNGDGAITINSTGGGGGGGTVTSITAGTGLTGGTITTSGTVAADFGPVAGKVTEGGTTVLKAGDTMTGKLAIQATDTVAALRVTQLGTGEALRVEDEANPDATAFVVSSTGKVGIGVTPDATAALAVDSNGISFPNGIQDRAMDFGANTRTVGVDGATIQACINSITTASSTNQFQILIPPGTYTENLTLKPCVSLAGTGANNGQTPISRIVGQHTFTGTATAADNIIQLSSLRFDNSSASNTFVLNASGSVPVLVQFDSCTIFTSNASTSTYGVVVNANVVVQANDVKSLCNATAGSGGTHFALSGGSLYATNLSTEFGTCAILMTGTNGANKPYCELKNCDIRAVGANLVNITSNTALFTAGWCSFSNSATSAKGFNIAAGSVVGVYNSSYTVTAGASNYLVDGAVGSYYFSALNNHSNSSLVPYETKIGASVAQVPYTTNMIPVANGGTGQTSYTNGQLLIGNASGGLTKATLTAGSNVTITNGDGAITIAATGGAAGVSSFSAGTTGLTPNTGTTGAVTLAGTLGVANGGTGATTLTGIVKGSGTSALSAAVAGTDYVVPSGSITGTASNVTGTVAIANGGTGETTRQAAMDALAGSTTSGQYLRGNGTDVVMSVIQAADVPTLNQNTTGTAANVTGTVAILNGGTGQTTANAALNALLPSQATNSGKVLSTDGTNTSWVTGGGGSATPTNRQVFLSSGTWTKPAGAKSVLIRLASSGYGGGAGSKGVPGRTVFGGSGGASGVVTEVQYDAAQLPSSLAVTISGTQAVSYPSYFCNNISASAAGSSSQDSFVTAPNSGKFYGATFATTSGTGSVGFLLNANGGSSTGPTSNAGAGSGATNTTPTGISASGGAGGQNSNSTGANAASKFIFGQATTITQTPPTTNFTTLTNNSCPSWSGAIIGNATSGGGGGITALGSATGGSGSDGGGYIAPVTLTNVATQFNSKTVTCASTTGLRVGMSTPDLAVTYSGSSAATVQVESIVNSTTFTINFPAVSTASGLTIVAAVGAGGGGGGGASIQSSTPILITGITLTSGSTTVNCTSTRGILPGMTIFSNANIPANTTVASLVSETQFIISAAATNNETAGKLVIAGAGTISGLTVTSGSGSVTAVSTLGLKWGQALCTTGSVGQHLNPSSAGTRFNHVAAVTSATNFVVSGTALTTGNALQATVINTVGFLSGVSTTSLSPIITVSDTTPLSPGMLVHIGTQGTWTTTTGVGATLASALEVTSAPNKFFGDGVVESPSNATTALATGYTTVTFDTPANVVASVTGTYFSTRINGGTNVLPEIPANPLLANGYSYARILTVDSATQITLDTNASATTSGATMMYAFSGGTGGRGSAGAAEIITYF